MSTYRAKVVEDEHGPILLFSEKLSRELGWGVGATVEITGTSDCLHIKLIEKGVQDSEVDASA